MTPSKLKFLRLCSLTLFFVWLAGLVLATGLMRSGIGVVEHGRGISGGMFKLFIASLLAFFGGLIIGLVYLLQSRRGRIGAGTLLLGIAAIWLGLWAYARSGHEHEHRIRLYVWSRGYFQYELRQEDQDKLPPFQGGMPYRYSVYHHGVYVGQIERFGVFESYQPSSVHLFLQNLLGPWVMYIIGWPYLYSYPGHVYVIASAGILFLLWGILSRKFTEPSAVTP